MAYHLHGHVSYNVYRGPSLVTRNTETTALALIFCFLDTKAGRDAVCDWMVVPVHIELHMELQLQRLASTAVPLAIELTIAN